MFYRPGLDPHGLDRNPFKALVAPRPIAWVSSLDGAGRANLAPFSFFNAVAEEPPILMFAPYNKKAEEPLEKDTLRNVLETGEYVINVPPRALFEKMVGTSGPFLAGEDEFEKVGLTKAPSEVVRPPRVAEAPASFECRLITRVELPSANPAYGNGAIFGEVVGVHIDPAVVREGRVDVTIYQPLARLGYLDYAAVERVFSMPRPKGGG